MNIQFTTEEDDRFVKTLDKYCDFYSLNFPDNINFKVGDVIYLMDFSHLLKKGNYYLGGWIKNQDEFAEFEETSCLCTITGISLGYINNSEYMLIVTVEWH